MLYYFNYSLTHWLLKVTRDTTSYITLGLLHCVTWNASCPNYQWTIYNLSGSVWLNSKRRYTHDMYFHILQKQFIAAESRLSPGQSLHFTVTWCFFLSPYSYHSIHHAIVSLNVYVFMFKVSTQDLCHGPHREYSNEWGVFFFIFNCITAWQTHLITVTLPAIQF